MSGIWFATHMTVLIAVRKPVDMKIRLMYLIRVCYLNKFPKVIKLHFRPRRSGSQRFPFSECLGSKRSKIEVETALSRMHETKEEWVSGVENKELREPGFPYLKL